MSCRYCYEKDKSSGNVPWEITKELLDNILRNTPIFEIEFLGGETLLNLPLIQQCVDYLKEKSTVTYFITTNGTIMSNEVVDFLQENRNIKICISMDGTRFANSLRVFKNGKNSFEIVVKNIKKLIEKGLVDRLLVHTVLHPYNVAYFSESVDLLYSLGVRHVDPGIVENTMLCTKEFQDTFIFEHQKVSKKLYMAEYPGLKVTTLHYPPLINKKKVYIRNEQGVIIGEYNGVKDRFASDNITLRLRTIVYENHKRRAF